MVAFCWAVCLCRNDTIFCQTFPNSYLQVIFKGTLWARKWSQLSKRGREESYSEKLLHNGRSNARAFCQEWLELQNVRL
jgi:hypothetical protein